MLKIASDTSAQSSHTCPEIIKMKCNYQYEEQLSTDTYLDSVFFNQVHVYQ